MADSDTDSDATYDPNEGTNLSDQDLFDEEHSPPKYHQEPTTSKPYLFKTTTSTLHGISDSDTDEEPILKKPKLTTKNPSKLQKEYPSKKLLSKQETLPVKKHEEQQPVDESPRPQCKYGSKCYRKNPSHFKEFSHPDTGQKTKAAPTAVNNSETSSHTTRYGFYLTKVKGISDKFNQHCAMDIKDILCSEDGSLKQSAQFNYMFDVDWLVQQYPAKHRDKPVLLVHGMERGNKADLDLAASKYSNIRMCQAKLEIMYGTHHTKMMLLLYDVGLKVVIHTANLISGDWAQKSQGIWLSPMFAPLETATDMEGDSVTHFKTDLLQYLKAYKNKALNEWIEIITRHNFESANVFLIGSVPGRHTGSEKHSFGHLKLRKCLEKFGPSPDTVRKWPVVGQFSSIGSLGTSEAQWLCGEFYTSLSAAKSSGTSLGGSTNNLKLIYPSKDNVRQSLEGYPAGGSLPYSINTAKKQPYLNNFLHQWKADCTGRSHASPHIKTYCRTAPDGQRISWFIVTSANLSKAAWGMLEKRATQLMIRSYELGVLFLPQFCISADKEAFNCATSTDTEPQDVFPVPYNLPPTPYQKNDRPWIWDIPYMDLPDSKGNMWCPR